MVCVEQGRAGLRTAQDFGRRFQLPASVLNGYVDQRCQPPSFGQLGCQGFVVLGLHGEFAMQRTTPCYLEAQEAAFRAVERLLSSLWAISLEPLPAGASSPPAIKKETMVLASVGVPEMDEEHKAIQEAVEELRRRKSPEAMQKLMLLWNQHSEHEEELFHKFDFGRHRTAGKGFAATAPHCEHHRHIASMMEQFTQGVASASSHIDMVMEEIQRHAELYDAAYAGKLAVDCF